MILAAREAFAHALKPDVERRHRSSIVQVLHVERLRGGTVHRRDQRAEEVVRALVVQRREVEDAILALDRKREARGGEHRGVTAAFNRRALTRLRPRDEPVDVSVGRRSVEGLAVERDRVTGVDPAVASVVDDDRDLFSVGEKPQASGPRAGRKPVREEIRTADARPAILPNDDLRRVHRREVGGAQSRSGFRLRLRHARRTPRADRRFRQARQARSCRHPREIAEHDRPMPRWQVDRACLAHADRSHHPRRSVQVEGLDPVERMLPLRNVVEPVVATHAVLDRRTREERGARDRRRRDSRSDTIHVPPDVKPEVVRLMRGVPSDRDRVAVPDRLGRAELRERRRGRHRDVPRRDAAVVVTVVVIARTGEVVDRPIERERARSRRQRENLRLVRLIDRAAVLPRSGAGPVGRARRIGIPAASVFVNAVSRSAGWSGIRRVRGDHLKDRVRKDNVHVDLLVAVRRGLPGHRKCEDAADPDARWSGDGDVLVPILRDEMLDIDFTRGRRRDRRCVRSADSDVESPRCVVRGGVPLNLDVEVEIEALARIEHRLRDVRGDGRVENAVRELDEKRIRVDPGRILEIDVRVRGIPGQRRLHARRLLRARVAGSRSLEEEVGATIHVVAVEADNPPGDHRRLLNRECRRRDHRQRDREDHQRPHDRPCDAALDSNDPSHHVRLLRCTRTLPTSGEPSGAHPRNFPGKSEWGAARACPRRLPGILAFG